MFRWTAKATYVFIAVSPHLSLSPKVYGYGVYLEVTLKAVDLVLVARLCGRTAT